MAKLGSKQTEGDSFSSLQCAGTNAFLRYNPGTEHEAKRLYRPCWSCGAAMGCPLCAGIDEQLICRDCLVPTEPASMIEVGPLSREHFDTWVKKGAHPRFPWRSLNEFPAELQSLWRRTMQATEKYGAILPRKIVRALLDGEI